MGPQFSPIVFIFVFLSSCLVALIIYMIDGFIYVSWSSTFVIFHVLFAWVLNSLGHRIAAINNDSFSHFRCSLRNHSRVKSPVPFSLSLDSFFSDSLLLFLSNLLPGIVVTVTLFLFNLMSSWWLRWRNLQWTTIPLLQFFTFTLKPPEIISRLPGFFAS